MRVPRAGNQVQNNVLRSRERSEPVDFIGWTDLRYEAPLHRLPWPGVRVSPAGRPSTLEKGAQLARTFKSAPPPHR